VTHLRPATKEEGGEWRRVIPRLFEGKGKKKEGNEVQERGEKKAAACVYASEEEKKGGLDFHPSPKEGRTKTLREKRKTHAGGKKGKRYNTPKLSCGNGRRGKRGRRAEKERREC